MQHAKLFIIITSLFTLTTLANTPPTNSSKLSNKLEKSLNTATTSNNIVTDAIEGKTKTTNTPSSGDWFSVEKNIDPKKDIKLSMGGGLTGKFYSHAFDGRILQKMKPNTFNSIITGNNDLPNQADISTTGPFVSVGISAP